MTHLLQKKSTSYAIIIKRSHPVIDKHLLSYINYEVATVIMQYRWGRQQCLTLQMHKMTSILYENKDQGMIKHHDP